MKAALFNVLVPFLICIALANTRLFDRVAVDLSYDHYADKVVDGLPSFLAMPFNCLINVGYIFMGLRWLFGHNPNETKHSRHVKEIFALMAIFYAPVQWARLATLRRPSAVLDQWFTLPIFAWVPVWSHFIEHGSASLLGYAVKTELCSILSYGLALVHERGFEAALGCHVAFAVYKGLLVQIRYGDSGSRKHMLLAILSCAGFVVLKLMDHWLAQYSLFQHLTGHFWSKVCDILQFHFSFCFLARLTESVHGMSKGQ